MQIAHNTVATIDYTLTDDEGHVLGTSEGGDPVAYLHGAGTLMPKLESALEGQAPGAALEVTVPAADAYGERDERLVRELSRSAFKGVDRVEEGMRFQATLDGGTEHVLTVTAVADDRVTVDGNHPLAGKALNFKVEVRDVRDATADEIAQGAAEAGET
jgi:FKBP-type peptidyl-prolyl cis-trans isomerase SlyD